MTTAAVIPPEVWDPQMRRLLAAIAHRVVVVGSVARTIRQPGFSLPKDLGALCDLDSDLARREIREAIEALGMRFESPFLASWTFRDYGWMVEILGVHHGPGYRTVRRGAERMSVGGASGSGSRGPSTRRSSRRRPVSERRFTPAREGRGITRARRGTGPARPPEL